MLWGKIELRSKYLPLCGFILIVASLLVAWGLERSSPVWAILVIQTGIVLGVALIGAWLYKYPEDKRGLKSPSRTKSDRATSHKRIH